MDKKDMGKVRKEAINKMTEYFRDERTNVKYVEVTCREYEPENLEECDKTVCCMCGYGTTLHNHRLYCGKRQDFLEVE